jgi:DnaK suppressor protein
MASIDLENLRESLERTRAELARVLRTRDGIEIEKSADQMDEIQFASERDLAIRNADRESKLLRQVSAALGRIQDGSFGFCTECESQISQRRLDALPWALRCIQCESAADRVARERADSAGERLEDAA